MLSCYVWLFKAGKVAAAMSTGDRWVIMDMYAWEEGRGKEKKKVLEIEKKKRAAYGHKRRAINAPNDYNWYNLSFIILVVYIYIYA